MIEIAMLCWPFWLAGIILALPALTGAARW